MEQYFFVVSVALSILGPRIVGDELFFDGVVSDDKEHMRDRTRGSIVPVVEVSAVHWNHEDSACFQSVDDVGFLDVFA